MMDITIDNPVRVITFGAVLALVALASLGFFSVFAQYAKTKASAIIATAIAVTFQVMLLYISFDVTMQSYKANDPVVAVCMFIATTAIVAAIAFTVSATSKWPHIVTGQHTLTIITGEVTGEGKVLEGLNLEGLSSNEPNLTVYSNDDSLRVIFDGKDAPVQNKQQPENLPA